MKVSIPTILSALLFLLFYQQAWAKNIMCWKNKQNIRECGESVPPEYAQQRIEVLNEQGMVVKVLQARKTKAQLAKEAAEAERQKARNERRRKDMILLKTYTREEDITATRDKQLTAIDGTISIADGNLKVLNGSLVSLQKQAANHERSGTPIPAHLVKDIDSARTQIKENEKYLAEKKRRRQEIIDQFAADLKRYRKLKNVKPR